MTMQEKTIFNNDVIISGHIIYIQAAGTNSVDSAEIMPQIK